MMLRSSPPREQTVMDISAGNPRKVGFPDEPDICGCLRPRLLLLGKFEAAVRQVPPGALFLRRVGCR